jgi:HD-GYP domain-containing protein (c-di-GMP phosphodiesterase class II)
MTSSRPYRLTALTHEQAVAELEKYSGLQFDPEIVPILLGLDRSILDRRPERPDELPTMLRQEDIVPAADEPAPPAPEGSPPPRPALASEDAP